MMMGPEELLAECSDEEEYNRVGISNGDVWGLTAEETVELYAKISTCKVLEFSWKCPGRKLPGQEKVTVEVKLESVDKQEPPPDTVSDFDFEEETTPTLRPAASKSTPKGGAKKKTTSFANIISNMERHKIIEQMPSENARSFLQPEPPLIPLTPTATSDSITESIDRVLETQSVTQPKEVFIASTSTTVTSTTTPISTNAFPSVFSSN